MNQLLAGKTYVIMGVANKRSIAWAIAKSLHRAGARLIFTYQGERLEQNVRELLESLERRDSVLLPCDVTKDEEITTAFQAMKEEVKVIHGIAHCIAFAKTEELEGEYADTSREGYHLAQDISAYSLVAVSKAAKGLMSEGKSVV